MKNIGEKEDKNMILEKLEKIQERIELERIEERKKIEERDKKKKESSSEKRIERKRKQKMLEEKWEMMRWITAFIDENQEEWESEKGLTSHEHLEACMPAKMQFSGKKKVSEFPIPEKPVRMRGAELAKLKFLRKMDKAYFSIMNLRDIKEETEPLEASMPSDTKPEIEEGGPGKAVEEMRQPCQDVRMCQPASKVAVERRAGWLCQPVSRTDDGAAVIRDLEASMPKMLIDTDVGVHDAISYAEVPPTIVKIKVKLICLEDDAEMSPSV